MINWIGYTLLCVVYTEAAVRRCSSKPMLLKISQYAQENTCAGVFFLINLQAWRLVTLFKRYSNTDVFLYIMYSKIFENSLFTEHLRWLLLSTTITEIQWLELVNRNFIQKIYQCKYKTLNSRKKFIIISSNLLATCFKKKLKLPFLFVRCQQIYLNFRIQSITFITQFKNGFVICSTTRFHYILH